VIAVDLCSILGHDPWLDGIALVTQLMALFPHAHTV
jgi:hypothetical protein